MSAGVAVTCVVASVNAVFRAVRRGVRVIVFNAWMLIWFAVPVAGVIALVQSTRESLQR